MESLVEVNEPKRMYTKDVLKFPRITFENSKSYKNLIFGASEKFTFGPKIVYLVGGVGSYSKY